MARQATVGGLQFLDRARDVERVAVAVVGIDHERKCVPPDG